MVLVNKSFLLASHLSHTVSVLIPALIEFFFSPVDKKHGVRFLMPSKNTSQCHLSSCRSLFGFKFLPSVLQFSLSSPSSLSLCFLPHPSVYIFGFRRLQRGGTERDEIGDGPDREMALVERRGCKFRFLKLLLMLRFFLFLLLILLR